MFPPQDLSLARSPAFQEEVVKDRPNRTQLGAICEALTGLLAKCLLVAFVQYGSHGSDGRDAEYG